MNLGPLIVQSVSSSTSLCTRPIHQIIAWLYPHFLLYMTRKFLVGEGEVFVRKVGHLHQPFCLFRCAWFLLSHTSVSFFCTLLLLHVPKICILCSPGFDLPLGSWLDFQTSSRGQCARSSVVLCLFYTVCIWGFISHFQWSGSTAALCISAWQFITNMPRPLTVTIAATPQMSASPAACNLGFKMLYWGKEKKKLQRKGQEKKKKSLCSATLNLT